MKKTELKNCPQWLLDAETKNEDVDFDEDGFLVWRSGDFLGGDFIGGNFMNGNFMKGDFRGGNFRGGYFLNGNFWGGDFWGGDFWGGDFWGGNFWGGNFRGGDFCDGNFWGGNFRGGDFKGGDFRGGDFRGGDFRGGSFCGGNFVGGNFKGGLFIRGYFMGLPIKHRPITIDGFAWPIVITHVGMSIGGQTHRIHEWEAFTDEDIRKHKADLLEFWHKHKDWLLSLCHSEEKAYADSDSEI